VHRLTRARSKARTPPLQHTRRPPPLNASPTKQLTHPNYNFLKDKDLKKKLQESGIPAFGSRQLLMRRYTQWVDIFNANLDSPHPRSNRELLRELDIWERTQGGHAPNHGQPVPTGVMKKDFDGTEWGGRHRNHFDDLVAKARAKIAPQSREEEEESTTNGESTTVTVDEEQKAEPSLPPATVNHEPNIPHVLTILPTAAHEIQARYTSPPISCSEPHSLQINQSTTNSPITRRDSDCLPEKMASQEGVRRLPMFQVPEDPVVDIEGLGGGGSV
jgi:E3 ubiquitin-protein ligase RAD18